MTRAHSRRRSRARSTISDPALSDSQPDPDDFDDMPDPLQKRGKVAPLARFSSALMLASSVYFAMLLALLISHRAQCMLVYLHWLRPPQFVAPLNNLAAYRLDSTARLISAGHLRGWHLLPPGPPFAPTYADGASGNTNTDHARTAFFDEEMRRLPNTRVVLFFHGNSGTRAFPFKRIDMLRLLGSNLGAHVVTFDYTGFGDSPGRPSEQQLYADARAIYSWVMNRTSDSAQIVIYGQSLGTFAASHLAASVCPREVPESEHPTPPAEPLREHASEGVMSEESHKYEKCGKLRAVILDAAPATLYDASLSHASTAVFSVMPLFRKITKYALHESHDSVKQSSLISVPLLVLHGEKDGLIPIEQGRRVHRAAVEAGNRHAHFVAFPNSGHNNVNAARNYLHVLDGFLSKFLAPASDKAI